MIRMRNVRAVFVKQVWDTLKNLQVLVLFIVYPVVTFVMIQAMGAQVGDRYFFLSMFAVMHCVFTPMVSTAAAVSEEKEKNTLRILILSGVKPVEYLLSIALFIWIATQVTGFAFIAMGNCSFRQGTVLFVLFTAGCLPSTLLGLCIGLQARNMAGANAVAVPVGMVFAFLPMLAFFNETIEKAARFIYSYQIGEAIREVGAGEEALAKGVVIAMVYLVLFFGLFWWIFRRRRWE